jgi:hypothetical protein
MPGHRFTIYDAMEARGDFRRNPANVGAVDSEGLATYRGPVQYPQMFYHPEGLTRVTVPAERVQIGGEWKSVGEQREIIWQIANNAAEAAKLAEAGWHDHPAKAIKASGRPAPSMGVGEQVKDLQSEIDRLKAELAARDAEEHPPAALPITAQPAARAKAN